MQQTIKRFLWIIGLAFSLQSAWAFSLAGPIGNASDAIWQVPVIGYGLPGDVNAPKNIGEDYRRNTPVIYYVYDETFSDFFGPNGEASVDGAFAIMNNAFTNNPTGLTNGLDGYSIALSEFSTETRHLNYQAQALGLFDLKSFALGAIIEQLGLADPVRYAWTLHDRFHVGSVACPVGQEYLVVQRNFNDVASPLNQLQYSPYVNDTLYSYLILEACNAPTPPQALAAPFSADPLADTYSAVAGFTSEGFGYGVFYTGLTRDDVAGLRYLLTTNNVHREDIVPGSLLQSTNLAVHQPLYTFSLTALFLASQTNDPVTLAGLFPGLVIGSSSNYLGVLVIPNIVAYYTNVIGQPAGTVKLVVVTNGFTYLPITNYVTTFANLVLTTNYYPNNYHTNTSAQLVTVQVKQKNGAPAGTLTTNTTVTTVTLTNVPSGDYFLIPPGTCGPNIISVLYTNVVATTNLVAATNSAGYPYSQSVVIYSTNHVFAVNPCTLVPNATDYYQGVERIHFVRIPDTNFDSYLGTFHPPVTNSYTMVVKTNGQYATRTFQRVVTAPDIRFAAADMASGPGSPLHPVVFGFARGLNFDQANVLNGLAGPGTINTTINPPTTITFEKVGPVFFNYFVTNGASMDGTPYFNETPGNDLTDSYYGLYFVWSSFDGSTNDPIVYPNGTSLANLQSQVLFQVFPASLPDGANETPYSATFTATGGQPSYTWSLATNSLASTNLMETLPAGLTMYPNGMISGLPSGNPPGTYDFTIQLTDSAVPSPRTLQLNYSINILPP
jgi:hypothetical protein